MTVMQHKAKVADVRMLQRLEGSVVVRRYAAISKRLVSVNGVLSDSPARELSPTPLMGGRRRHAPAR